MTTTHQANILEPVVVRRDEDRAPYPIHLAGHDIVLKVTGQDSGGNFALGILKAEPMSGPPLHMHTREDEWFYVLKGELTFQVGDRRFTAGPGTSVFAPRNVPHTWQNCTGQTAEAIGMVTPPQAEGFFLEAARGSQHPATMEALSHRYGIRLLGPPLWCFSYDREISH